MKSGKGETTGGIEWKDLPNQERIRTLGEMENYKYVEILELDTIKQVISEKRVSQTNEKTDRNQPQLQKSH